MGRWFVAALLWLYPPDFRAKFGPELMLFHERHRADPRFRGARGAIRFWTHTVLDVVKTAAAEWWSMLSGDTTASRPAHSNLTVGTRTFEMLRHAIPHDMRIAIRGLARHPGFTAVAVVTLALGLGGSGAIYTMLKRVVLDPLPYPQPHELVTLTNRVPGVDPDAEWNMSTAQFVYFSEHASSLAGVGLYRGMGANIETPSGPERSVGWRVTASVLPLLGAAAHIGRILTSSDDRPGAPLVTVLSHGFWQQRFGGDESVLGATITIDDAPYEIVGVLDRAATIPGAPPGSLGDFWVPMRIDPEGSFGNNHVFTMVARLAPGTTLDDVESEIEILTTRLPDRFPVAYNQSFFDRYGFRTIARPLKDAIVGEMADNLWIVFAGVSFVLLIAIANVANLFLVRFDGRRHDLAVRRALGAGPWTVVRHTLAETMSLSLAGGALALVVGTWGMPALAALAPNSLPRLDAVGLGTDSILFVGALSVLVGFVLAAYPLVRGSSGSAGGLGTERGATGGRERQRMRAGLVIAQVALALTLAAGAGLLIESMRALSRIDAGIDADGVLTAGIFLNYRRYDTDAEIWSAYRLMLERVRAIPGVEAAGMSTELPILNGFGCTVQGFEDRDVYQRIRDAGLTTCAGQEPTTPGYFEALGIPVLQGRSFTDADNDDPSRAAVVVSRAFADRFWPGENPIDKGVMPSGRTVGPPYRVIGVVGDAPARALDGETAIAIYYPVVHNPNEEGNWGGWMPVNMTLVVKTGFADPLVLAGQVRDAVQAVDAGVPVAHIASMEAIVRASIARFRFASVLLGIAAGIALTLSAVGLYGVVSYVVGRNTREIGIRIAIGARPAAVSRSIVERSLGLVGAGVLVGLAAALIATRAMRGLLFGVEPTQPSAYLGATLLLAFIGTVAAWMPARRAARVDPVEALRTE